MEDFQQPRLNPSPHHNFLGSTTDAVGGGGPLQGARTADAWVVEAKERHLSYSGQRNRPTQCFLDVSDNSPPLSAFYQDRRWSQREGAKGRGGSMEVVQQPR
ncbi:hypothetical protein RHMOL_Rhmol09G0066200 [Rhododendron molle]|uniref:Uncharacterized protein n=1 Tax=Rhododendron molle TaxID=49168 RepID=A0ACC0MCG4_RHOML|nr:hypothetical protein RHMOL_Rhmol09G0066200 [Rhododendron molle]